MLAPAQWEGAAGPEGDGGDGRRRTLRGARAGGVTGAAVGGTAACPRRAGPPGAARGRHEVPARRGRDRDRDRDRDGSPSAPAPGGIGLLPWPALEDVGRGTGK